MWKDLMMVQDRIQIEEVEYDFNGKMFKKSKLPNYLEC